MLLRSLMFMMWRRDLGTDSMARSLTANALAASSRVGHVEPYSMHRARSDSRRYSRFERHFREEPSYRVQCAVHPGIIRGLVLPRGNFPGIIAAVKVARVHHVTVSR